MTSDGRKKLWTAGIVFGALVGCGAPYCGMALTTLGIVRVFELLGSQGVGDPSKLSAAIGEVLISTVVGIVLAIPGFVVMVISMVRLRILERQTVSPPSHAAP